MQFHTLLLASGLLSFTPWNVSILFSSLVFSVHCVFFSLSNPMFLDMSIEWMTQKTVNGFAYMLCACTIDDIVLYETWLRFQEWCTIISVRVYSPVFYCIWMILALLHVNIFTMQNNYWFFCQWKVHIYHTSFRPPYAPSVQCSYEFFPHKLCASGNSIIRCNKKNVPTRQQMARTQMNK